MRHFILKKTLAPFALALSMLGGEAMAAISTKPVTKNATVAAEKLYTFLLDNYGKNTISGVQTGDLDGTTEIANNVDIDLVYQKSGKYPALVGIDFLMATGAKEADSWYQNYTKTGVLLAKQLWQKGGIPAFTWHWKDPSRETEEHSTKAAFDYTKAFKAGTTEFDTESEAYQIMIKDIDVIADILLDLQKDGVACIWRPLHEASGAWFWWGTGTGEQYKALYQMLYKRMVEVKGVKNCIWVWNMERTPSIGYDEKALDPSWYPGDEYVDIIAIDVYKNANDHGSLIEYHESLSFKVAQDLNTEKILALSENGPIPDVDNMQKDGAVWSWWMPWYNSWDSGFINQTSDDVWKKNMASDKIITLDEMKDWGTYTGAVTVSDPCELNTATHIEAECADYKGVEVASDKASAGKGISVQDNDGYIKFEFDIPADGQYDIVLGGLIPYGEGKVASVVIDGASADVAINEDGLIAVGTFKLKKGKQTISVIPGWTWWAVDYMEVTPASSAAITPSPTLQDDKATENANKLYSFLLNNFGKNIISGFMAGSMDGADGTFKNHEDFKVVYQKSGKYPALGGVDFMNATGLNAKESWYKDYTNKSLAIMEDLWTLGGIPAFTWHWRDPSLKTGEFYSRYEDGNLKTGDTDFDYTTAMTKDGEWDENSEIYQNMISDIDIVADYFLALQEKGVAGIFRPLHEASGGWFWWGRQGGENYAKLYQLIRHEMVDVKGVHNLVWVWNPGSTADADWNPGAENYDVISIDIYNKEFDYQSNYVSFNNLKKLSDNKKLIALSENGPVVDPDQCIEDESIWSWMMPWYQSWSANFANQTSEEQWKKVMAHENVITLDEMPGWDKYEASISTQISDNGDIVVFPSKVKEQIIVASKSDYKVMVYSVNGTVVENDSHSAGSSAINATSWAKGIYVVSVETADGATKTVEVIK